MSSRWKLQYSVNVTPIEEVELSGYHAVNAPNEISRNIHSGIDKSVGGSVEYTTTGDSSSNIKYANILTTDTFVALENTLGNLGGTTSIIYMKITGAATDATAPELEVSIDAGSNTTYHMAGIGDQILLRFKTPVDLNAWEIKSNAAANLCYFDIMVGYN